MAVAQDAIMDPNERDPSDDWTTMAIVERTGSMTGSIGIACLNLSTLSLHLDQFEDDKNYTKLESILRNLDPKKVLTPNVIGEERKNNVLFASLQGNYEVIPRDRRSFDHDKGIKNITEYSLKDRFVLDVDLKGKQACFAAAGALFDYFLGLDTTVETVINAKSLKVIVGSDNTMFIDPMSSVALELLNSESGSWRDSLFGLVNFTKSKAGVYLLKSLILQPSTKEEEINNRLDAVQELTENKVLLESVSDFFRASPVNIGLSASRILKESVRMTDTEKLLEDQIDAIVFIRHALQSLYILTDAFANSNSKKLQNFYKILTQAGIGVIIEEIRKYIADEMSFNKGSLNFKCAKVFAVKPNFNPYIGIKRGVYSNLMQDVVNLSEDVRRQLQLPEGSVKLVHSVNRGFHLEIPTAQLEGVQTCPVIRSLCMDRPNAKYSRFTNTLLESQNRKINAEYRSIIQLSYQIILELLIFMRDRIDIIHDVVDCLAEVDVIASLAIAANVYGLTRPNFGNEVFIRKGRNPIFVKRMSEKKMSQAVANDTKLNASSSVHLINGANMSGKSCYIRQGALITILGQIGSFIPAEEGSTLRITDQIFTRIGSDDDLETNTSTFAQEVKQLRYIIEKATNKSLCIIDELGRGTSCEEGAALCVAFLEELMKRGSYVLFATHFIDINALQSMYPKMGSMAMETIISRKMNQLSINFTHKLLVRRDGDKQKNYGINLAEVSGMNPIIVQEAHNELQKVCKSLQRKIL
jgi:DNA mismatch repair protein MSH4